MEAVENRQKKVRVEVRRLERFALRLQEELGLGQESVGIRLVTDAEMAKLNEEYRGKKGPTDVLSFPSEKRRRPETLKAGLRKARATHLGDIAIAPAVALRNAKEYGRALSEELEILILHGVLHLLGYDHETDRGEMNRVENRLRRRLGLA